MNDSTIQDYARKIADSIIDSARTSGTDPIAWVTGNNYMPPLRSFSLAEEVWQDDVNDDGEAFAWLVEEVERHVRKANVALEYPDYDNALYAVDLARFEYIDDEPGETLQSEWRPIA